MPFFNTLLTWIGQTLSFFNHLSRSLALACIDANGNITRSAELILLAMMKPASVDVVASDCGLPLFRVRAAVRELRKAGLLTGVDGLFQITDQGILKLEGRNERATTP
jgi:predicted transcriptional regulator